ncbi:MAG: flagellar basal-body rod protein FlgF [Epsilonproteobacteria bacterium]|nr:MAG: flagellar basal-body rod protein FlgF [Campylobacterota bacterium]RLA67516.1 MAG: flagellar basal-body rod protein FlgF [Campylobacterota bacterium]
MKDIWVPLSGAIAQQRNVETIANNLANSNTPGFKKDKLTFKEQLATLNNGLQAAGIDASHKIFTSEDFYRSYGAENAKVKVDGSYTDHRQGDLRHTGNPLDLAVNGPGFFELNTPNGVRFTRKGTFSLSGEGYLVNEKGFPVLSKLAPLPKGESSDPAKRTVKITGQKISLNHSGEIFVDGKKINDLSVVEFKDIAALKKEGNSLFINNYPENLISDVKKSTLHQGFLEGSNVNPLEEMSALIKASRHFESIQQVLKAYDNISGKAVNEIAKF